MTNYFDKQGNYINCENLSLAEIYHRAFALGVESVPIEGKRPCGQVVPDTLQGWRYEERPQGDLISRSELKKCAIPCEIHNGALTDLCVPLYQINNAPTVKYTFEEAFQKTVCENKLYCPARPQGEWIMNKTSASGRNYTCTVCNKLSRNKFGFCPNCGEDMKHKEVQE